MARMIRRSYDISAKKYLALLLETVRRTETS